MAEAISNSEQINRDITRIDFFDVEDVIALYGALRTYLHALIQQPAEDYEMIARVTRLIIAIKPQAVEASQEIAGRKNNGD